MHNKKTTYLFGIIVAFTVMWTLFSCSSEDNDESAADGGSTKDSGKDDGGNAGGDGSGDAGAEDTACIESSLNLVDKSVYIEKSREILAAVKHSDGYGFFYREELGDRKSLCPDCNDEEYDFCSDCMRDVLHYESVNAAGEVLANKELDLWYGTGPGAGITLASAAIASDGSIAVIWGRNHAGSSKLLDMQYQNIDVSGEPLSEPVFLTDQMSGRYRVITHPAKPLVLILRDHYVLLLHLGVHLNVLSLDGTSHTGWLQFGSSLAYEAGAAPYKDGFAVIFSDQSVDEPDPDCKPCETMEECFGSLTPTEIDVTEDPSESGGCNHYLDATENGGLQLVVIGESVKSEIVQVRSGWYDRIFNGKEETLYTDHEKNSLIETDKGIIAAGLYQGKPLLLDMDIEKGTVEEHWYPFDYEKQGSHNWLQVVKFDKEPFLIAGLFKSWNDEDGAAYYGGGVIAYDKDENKCPLNLFYNDQIYLTPMIWSNDSTFLYLATEETKDYQFIQAKLHEISSTTPK